MKRNWKVALAGGTAVALLVGTMTVSSLAAVGRKTAYLDYQNMKVTLNGEVLDLRDGNGDRVEPFTIDGTTYLPLAAIGRALGMDVAWDADSKTVILTTDQAVEDGTYIGTAKAKWMEKETSRGTILFSQRLRRALDPKGLLNSTKLVGI